MYDTLGTINEYLAKFNLKEMVKRTKKEVSYYNIPCAFDIESTSCYLDTLTNEHLETSVVSRMKEKKGKNFDNERYEKRAFMYIWQLSIDDNIIIGRTWEDFKVVINKIVEYFGLNLNNRLIIYVHNLAFELQFIKSLFTFENVFSSDMRKPMKALTTNGLEFKCSYFLSGCSLNTVAKNLTTYKTEKMVGDLDYTKIRTSNTPLTDKELKYCTQDVVVVSNYIRECMEKERYNSLLTIPLTKTGYVRRDVRKHCLSKYNRKDYQKIISQFTLTPQHYVRLRKLFSGGFTHANALNSNRTFDNVRSYDFTSSYPAVLLLEGYPMGKGYSYTPKDSNDFIRVLKNYCCIFDIELINVRAKEGVFENIISSSKCIEIEGAIKNNGRVVSADRLVLTVNEVDFRSILRFYDWDEMYYSDLVRYKKGYLPKPLLECVLNFYSNKTTLKDVKGQEIEYLLSKANLNSIYGMMVTDPVRDEVTFDGENWGKEFANPEEQINKYNENENRFIAYEWGIWCTSYARRNLYTAIIELGKDYIYSDTDSVKFINYEEHKDYFEQYNKIIEKKIDDVCEHYHFNKNDFVPKTIKGKTKMIGVWDDDGVYSRFKTLGAKRYMVEYEGSKEINITVSGVNKTTAVPYILSECKLNEKDPFDFFTDGMYFPADNSGKKTHTYIDDSFSEYITDYLGNTTLVSEKSSVHLENSPYELSLNDEYVDYLEQLIYEHSK